MTKKEQEQLNEGICECGHHTKDHSYSLAPEYNDLECDKCKCQNYKFKKTNKSRPQGIFSTEDLEKEIGKYPKPKNEKGVVNYVLNVIENHGKNKLTTYERDTFSNSVSRWGLEEIKAERQRLKAEVEKSFERMKTIVPSTLFNQEIDKEKKRLGLK